MKGKSMTVHSDLSLSSIVNVENFEKGSKGQTGTISLEKIGYSNTDSKIDLSTEVSKDQLERHTKKSQAESETLFLTAEDAYGERSVEQSKPSLFGRCFSSYYKIWIEKPDVIVVRLFDVSFD